MVANGLRCNLKKCYQWLRKETRYNYSVKVLAYFLAYMEEISYLCKWISVRHTFQKLFKIKGYDFIQVQAISDKEDEAFG